MSRNAIYDALMAVGAAIVPSYGVSWGETGRRCKTPDQSQMPALFQVELEEKVDTNLLGQVGRHKLEVLWVIYQSSGTDQTTVPAKFSADAIDNIVAAFSSNVGRQTLGGLAYAAYVNGSIKRFMGDVDGIEIITVPITILVP